VRENIVPIDLPSGPCLIDADAPPKATTDDTSTSRPALVFGMSHVFVGGISVAAISSLGDIRHVRVGLAAGKPTSAGLALETDMVTVRGTVPVGQDTSASLELYPRTRAVRDGWLEYKRIAVVNVKEDRIEPRIDLPPWLTPAVDFASTPYLVACADLSPFGTIVDETPDAALKGTATLEDDEGRAVATVEPPREGIPVRALRKVKGKTKIRFAVGERAAAEVWVPTARVRETAWGALGHGGGSGRARPPASIECRDEIPLRVRVRDVTFAWGVLHANQKALGRRTGDGRFVLSVGGDPQTAVFVTSEAAMKCMVANENAP
jgi:hypothetical protein